MNILVAEDQALTRMRIQRLLESWGHTVAQAVDGGQAWEIFQEKYSTIDLVITDWMMPGMSGLELVPRLRRLSEEKRHYIYVIFLTGKDAKEDLVAGLEQGMADDYLTKPFDAGELRARVKVGQRTVQLERALNLYGQGMETMVRLKNLELTQSREELLTRLMSSLAYRDHETGDHVRRIGDFSAMIAGEIGWPKEKVEELRTAAAMHDIGKIGVPDMVLKKPGRLTLDEFETIKTHTVIGSKILEGSNYPLVRMAEQIALGHHEKWKGGGYPQGLSGEEIPEAARIVAIVDVFDALRYERVYRPALSMEQVMEIMREGEGGHFEPRLFQIFLKLLPEFLASHPPGGEGAEQ